MALNKNLISFPLTGGLDTKTDSKNLEFGSLSVAENIIYDTVKAWRKRSGYDSVDSLELSTDEAVVGLKKLAKFKKELLSFNDSAMYAYSKSFNRWLNRGTIYNMFPETDTIIKRFSQQDEASFLFVEGFKVYAYSDSIDGVCYSVVDNSDNNIIVSYALISTTGSNPKLASIDNDVFIVYQKSGQLYFKKFNIANPTVVSSEVSVAADFDSTTNIFDVLSIQKRVVVAYNSTDAGNELKMFFIKADETLGSTLTIAGENASNAIDLTITSQGRILLTFASSTAVKIAVFNSNLTTAILSPTLVEAVNDTYNVTSIANGTTYNIFYEIEEVLASNHHVRRATSNVTGIPMSLEGEVRSIGLFSKPFLYDNEVFLPVIHSSSLQSTYFILNSSGELISKFNDLNAGVLNSIGGLPQSIFVNPNELEIVGQIKSFVTTETGSFSSSLGISSTKLQLKSRNVLQNAELNNNLHIAAGIIKMYDGIVLVEHGFLLFPEGLQVGATAAVGGFMSDGIYDYVAVYSWTDNQGNIHRSAASLSVTSTLSGGGTTQTRSIVVPTLRLTDKQDVIIELYRTENAGVQFYKVTSEVNPVYNNVTVDTVTIVDTLADITLIAREALYTTGDVLENIAPPSAKLLSTLKNRVILAGLDKKNTLQYSKETFQGAPVEFNDELTISISPTGGEVTAILEMDEKWVIFKESAIFYVSGSGPNNLGEQNNFTDPDLVTSDIGCVDANSVILTPAGIMFKSRKGIYMLTRGMGLNYIGKEVEAYNEYHFTSAEIVPDLNQVRFLTDDLIALTYNYEQGKWAVFTNHAGLSSVNLESTYYYIRTDSLIFKENKSKFTDNGSPIKLKTTTGWMNLGEKQNLQRVYKAFILGSYKSPHKIRVRVAYDYVEAFTQEVIIDIADFINTATYGSEGPFGLPVESNYGGTDISGNKYQIRIDLQKQKCAAIKISIEDIQGSETGEGLSISDVAFEVGLKQGPFKIEQNRQYGTS